jgi:poly(3-hydroxybutyrate) depolymerase
MKSTFSAVGLLGLISSINGFAIRDVNTGCGAALPEGVKPNESIEQNLGDRRYRLHLPPGYDGKTKLPLILSFHGRTQNGTYQEKLSKFSNATYGFQGIAVYPEGVKFTTDVSFLARGNMIEC